MLKMIASKMKITALCIALLCVATIGALAQSTTQGAIGGTVFDATGAVIASAKVTIHNDETNQEQVVVTDASGYYKAPLLQPGNYTVSVNAPGFNAYKAAAVVILGQTTEVSPHVTTGSATSVVEVVAQVPILNFDSPDFTSTLNTRALENVPVNNLRWSVICSGEHSHGLPETEAALHGSALGFAEVFDHALQPLPVNFNPAAAHQREPIGPAQQSLDLSRSQRLAIKHNLHSEIEKRILSNL